MQLQRRDFLKSSAAAATIAAIPVLASEPPPWMVGAIEDTARNIACALNEKAIRTEPTGKLVAYGETIDDVQFNQWFYVSFKCKESDRDSVRECYLDPGGHTISRGIHRVLRAQVLNVKAGSAELGNALGTVCTPYPKGHCKSIEIVPTMSHTDWIDQQLIVGHNRYGVIEGFENHGLAHLLLDRPLDSELRFGTHIFGGLVKESVRFNNGVCLMSAPMADRRCLVRNGLCMCYSVTEDLTVVIDVLCGMKLDHIEQCERYAGRGSC